MSIVKKMKKNLRYDVQTVIKKPNAIINYIKFIDGVDRADQCLDILFYKEIIEMIASYSFEGDWKFV